jgi:sec-independent protein translocase protein TatC
MNESSQIISGVPGDIGLPITAHLKELRSRLVVVLAVMFVSMLAAYPFSEYIIQVIWTNFVPEGIHMSVYSPLEWIIARLKLSLVFGIAAAVPLFLYELFSFAATGLYPSERRFFIKIVPPSFILFILGGSLAYFLFLPVFFQYIIFYSNDVALAQISVQRTLSVVTTLVMGFGLVFQLPLLIVFALKMGLVKKETLKKQRFVVYAVLFGLAVFVSPDPTFVAQFFVAVLLAVLFEFSLVLAKVF